MDRTHVVGRRKNHEKCGTYPEYGHVADGPDCGESRHKTAVDESERLEDSGNMKVRRS